MEATRRVEAWRDGQAGDAHWISIANATLCFFASSRVRGHVRAGARSIRASAVMHTRTAARARNMLDTQGCVARHAGRQRGGPDDDGSEEQQLSSPSEWSRIGTYTRA